MLGIELRVAVAARKLLRCCDGLLALDRQFVEIHLCPFRVPLLAIHDEVAAVLLVNFLNFLAHLRLQAIDLRVSLAQLVLEPQHELDTGEIQAELRREPLDDAEALDVRLAVEARAAGRPLRAHETLVLVDPKCLRVHADELRRDADHVHRAVAHVSLRFMSMYAHSPTTASATSPKTSALIISRPSPSAAPAARVPSCSRASAPGCARARARRPCRRRSASARRGP